MKSKSLPDLLREKSPEHHTRYLYIKQLARSEFQEYATLVGYLTNHGPQHYQNLEANLDSLLPDDLKDQLAVEEIFLLLCAVHFHDVGLLSEQSPDESWTDVRKDHVNRTYDYIHEYYQNWGLNQFEAFALQNICLGHGGDTLYQLPEETVIHYDKIHIHFLAALLRIADELDLDYTRVSPTMMALKKIPEESLRHWEKHREISGVWIDSKSWMIEVYVIRTDEVGEAIIEELVEQKLRKALDYVSPIFKEYHLYYRQVTVQYIDYGNKRSSSQQPAQSKQDARTLDQPSQGQTATPPQRVREAQQQPPVEQHLPQNGLPHAPGPSAQQDDLDEDEINRLSQDLINSSQSVFDNVIRIYDPPSGVARTGTIPSRVDELMKTARGRGDLLKLWNIYFNAMGMTPPPVKKKAQSGLTDGSKQADPAATGQLSPVEQARVDVKEAQSHVKQADALFPKGISASPENLRSAREHLTSVRKCIRDLETLLNTHISSSLPEPLASNKARITGWIPRVDEHLDKLLESLNKGIYGDSKSLRSALSEIQQLIPG